MMAGGGDGEAAPVAGTETAPSLLLLPDPQLELPSAFVGWVRCVRRAVMGMREARTLKGNEA